MLVKNDQYEVHFTTGSEHVHVQNFMMATRCRASTLTKLAQKLLYRKLRHVVELSKLYRMDRMDSPNLHTLLRGVFLAA